MKLSRLLRGWHRIAWPWLASIDRFWCSYQRLLVFHWLAFGELWNRRQTLILFYWGIGFFFRQSRNHIRNQSGLLFVISVMTSFRICCFWNFVVLASQVIFGKQLDGGELLIDFANASRLQLDNPSDSVCWQKISCQLQASHENWTKLSEYAWSRLIYYTLIRLARRLA